MDNSINAHDELNNTEILNENSTLSEDKNTCDMGETLENEKPQADENSQEKLYTQEQINSIVAKESGKAVEKALRELGFDGNGKAKEQLSQFKEALALQQSQFDELEAEKNSLAELLSSEKELLNEQLLKNALYDAGVVETELENAMSVARSLQQTGYEIAKISAVVAEKFPHLCAEKREIPSFSVPIINGNDTVSKIKNIFKSRY